MTSQSSCSPCSTRLISWNVKGMNHPIKRTRIFTHLKSLGADIIFLQETHLLSTDCSKLQRGWVDHIFCSNYGARARGVAILIKKGTPFAASQVITDTNGRYIIITGKLHGTPVILANVYGPNWDNPQFFSKLIAKLPDINSHQLLMAGDWNFVLDPILDRSRVGTQGCVSKAGEVIKSFLSHYRLRDPWRSSNPTTRQYSFYSPVHKSYSRIDYFIVDDRSLSFVSHSKYHSIVISDHCPIQLDLQMPNSSTKHRTWRFDPLLLNDKDFTSFISSQIDFFFETNTTPDVSYSTIWEAFKAYIRGQIISYTAQLRSSRNFQLTELSKKIKDLDSRAASDPSNSNLHKERLLLQSEYDCLSIKDTEQLLFKSKQVYYEHSDRAGRLLAHQLRQKTANTTIPEIRIAPDKTTTHPQDINDQFKDYYTGIYTPEANLDSREIQEFLDKLEIPQINQEAQTSIDAPISCQEIMQAISSLQSGKAAGPDGISVEFYKAFSNKLAPILSRLYADILSSNRMPDTMNQAVITLLMKKGKDPLECNAYRPISLLCYDYKVLTKILARRLETVISDLISTDQTGFMPGRQSFFNMRRLLSILHSNHSSDTPEVLLSLDAERAFDRILWPFLFEVLGRFGFGPTFLTWVNIIYNAPQAAVRTNLINSNFFTLHCGVRQGCCLSPFLFNLAIEPLAIALRADNRLPAIVRGGLSHKVSLYADDLLLYLSDPAVSLPRLIHFLDHVKRISGYKLNFSKSIIFPINSLAQNLDYHTCPFRLDRESFTYLGIVVTRTYKNLYEANFKRLIEKMKLDLKRWSTLPISLAGRVNTVKMTVLPKFLYAFQMLPLFLPFTFFKELNSHISTFIWNNSVPRARRAILEMPKLAGGLALPNFMVYYWAANLSKLPHWITAFRTGQNATWVTMEIESCPSSTPLSSLCSSFSKKSNYSPSNTVTKHTLKIWRQFRKHYNLKHPSGFMPITHNNIFPAAKTDSAFLSWYDSGIVFFKDLFHRNTFISFETLRKNFSLPQVHFFRYLQARSFAREHYPFPHLPDNDLLDQILGRDPTQKGIISFMYNIILNSAMPSIEKTRCTWEQDLGVPIPASTWEGCLDWIHTSSLCLRHNLIQFKILHRLHFSRERLAHIYPNTDPHCLRCHQGLATLGHMFWSCPSLTSFWTQIFDAFTHMCGSHIPLDPVTAVFGVIGDHVKISTSQTYAIAFGSLLARRLILRQWKSANSPSFLCWVKEVLASLPLEKLRYSRGRSSSRFHKTWSPFLEFAESLSFERQ